jgi:hypothetical protein
VITGKIDASQLREAFHRQSSLGEQIESSVPSISYYSAYKMVIKVKLNLAQFDYVKVYFYLNN